jgi:hypothetical protein
MIYLLQVGIQTFVCSGGSAVVLQLAEEDEIMRSTRRTFLKGVGAAAGMAALGHASALRGTGAQAAGETTVTMWASPFVPGTSVDAPFYYSWLARNAPTALPNVRIPSDYGPGPYATMQSKYLVQAPEPTDEPVGPWAVRAVRPLQIPSARHEDNVHSRRLFHSHL